MWQDAFQSTSLWPPQIEAVKQTHRHLGSERCCYLMGVPREIHPVGWKAGSRKEFSFVLNQGILPSSWSTKERTPKVIFFKW